MNQLIQLDLVASSAKFPESLNVIDFRIFGLSTTF
jgi:hypothetical protein